MASSEEDFETRMASSEEDFQTFRDELQAEVKDRAHHRVSQFLAQIDRKSLQDFRVAMLDTFIVSDKACCSTAGYILARAWENHEDKVDLVPLLDDLIRHLRDPERSAEPFQALLQDACAKRHEAVLFYGTESDDDIPGSSIATEIPPVPDNLKVHCTAVNFNGHETRLYLTTHSAAPIIVALLNGLALSDQGHLIGVHKDDLSMVSHSQPI